MSNGVDRQDDDKTWYQYITSFEPTFEVEVAFVKAIVDADCEPADLEPMVLTYFLLKQATGTSLASLDGLIEKLTTKFPKLRENVDKAFNSQTPLLTDPLVCNWLTNAEQINRGSVRRLKYLIRKATLGLTVAQDSLGRSRAAFEVINTITLASCDPLEQWYKMHLVVPAIGEKTPATALGVEPAGAEGNLNDSSTIPPNSPLSQVTKSSKRATETGLESDDQFSQTKRQKIGPPRVGQSTRKRQGQGGLSNIEGTARPGGSNANSISNTLNLFGSDEGEPSKAKKSKGKETARPPIEKPTTSVGSGIFFRSRLSKEAVVTPGTDPRLALDAVRLALERITSERLTLLYDLRDKANPPPS